MLIHIATGKANQDISRVSEEFDVFMVYVKNELLNVIIKKVELYQDVSNLLFVLFGIAIIGTFFRCSLEDVAIFVVNPNDSVFFAARI